MSLRYVTSREYKRLSALATYFEDLLPQGKTSFKQTNTGWKIHISTPKYELYKEFEDDYIMSTPPIEIISDVSKLIISKLS